MFCDNFRYEIDNQINCNANLNLSRIESKLMLLQWRIQDFREGVRQLPKVLLFFNFFAENCMKMKEFGLPGGRVPGAPLGSANVLLYPNTHSPRVGKRVVFQLRWLYYRLALSSNFCTHGKLTMYKILRQMFNHLQFLNTSYFQFILSNIKIPTLPTLCISNKLQCLNLYKGQHFSYCNAFRENLT